MSEALEIAGAIAAGGLAATAMLASDSRARAAASLAALGLAFALVVGEGWDELAELRDRPAALAAAIAALVLAVGLLAASFWRWPWLAPVLIVAALPFRVQIETGGNEANLLIPLYLAVAAAALAYAAAALRGRQFPAPSARFLALALAAAIVLYAIQSSYSNDVAFAARNVGFFLVPFAVMFALLVQIEWTPRLLALVLAVVLGEGLVFAGIGIWQHSAGELFWNPALEMSNDFHFYFRVNSLFWDPNIYGRYLVLAIVLAGALLLWTRSLRRFALLAAAIAVIFAGLVFAFSQTSFIALLAGLLVLAGLRWSAGWALLAAPVLAALAVAAVLIVGGTSESEDSAREITSGRSTLVEGGIDLAEERPVWGHGSASFPKAFAEQEDIPEGGTTISHNEPVTVAAEQGLVGLLAYAAVIAAGLWTLLAGLRGLAPGLRRGPSEIADPLEHPEAGSLVARVAIAAGFCALLVHTIGYGGHLSDPLTWALLAAGAALADAVARAPAAARAPAPRPSRGRPVDAPT